MYHPCNADDCERIIRGDSVYCSMHRRRHAKHGDANYIHTKTLPLIDRFNLKYRVCPDTGCWLWTGGKNKSGYGTMAATEFGTLAHRISYGLNVGPIPKSEGAHGTCVCHTCDTRLCVNPKHLFLGSNADNVADRDIKGRHNPLRGPANGNSKLTEISVSQIKGMISKKFPPAEIAMVFGVSQSNISDIKHGKIWKHVK